MRLPAAALTSLALLLSVPPAAYAACYENLGQTGCPDRETFSKADLSMLSCQNLWHLRNSIYNDHGYCFRTKAAKDVFDNSDCYENDASQLRFNRHERANIDRIVRIEKERGCRAP